MNERILELAKQAGLKFPSETDLSPMEKKFAELLIRECIVQIGNAIPDTNCSAAGAYKTAKLAATSRVKEHFGVEE